MPESGRQPLSARPPKAVAAKGKAGGSGGGGSLEEITNQIFDDLMRGKSQLAHGGFDELGVMELDKAKVKNEEGRSLGLFGLLRRESWGAKDKKSKNKGKVTFTLPGNDGKKKGKEKDGEHLIQLLSGAQGLRLEDQRGIEVSTGEMPSFLNQDVKAVRSNSNHHGVMEVHMDQSPPSTMTAGQDRTKEDSVSTKGANQGRNPSIPTDKVVNPRHSSSSPHWQTPRLTETPRGRKEPFPSKGVMSSDKWNSVNKSFGPDSIIPSPNTATAYFQMSPEIVDSQKYLFGSHKPPNVSSPHLASHSHETHSFRPHQDYFHSSFSPPSKSPVVTPDNFSQEDKISHSPESNGGLAMMVLPSKMSPSFHSSHSSSSSSNGSQRRPSPISKSQPPQAISRMSDGMLLHKLQKARKSNLGQRSNNPLSNSQSHSTSRPSDLAQRALLSPRFNDSSQFIEENQKDMTQSQRALLSPRFNQSYYNTSSIPISNITTHHTPNSHHNIYDIGNHTSFQTPVSVRTSSPFKNSSSESSSFNPAKPVSSSAGPQFSNWHYKSSSLPLSPRQIHRQSHSVGPRQPAVSFEYLEDAGETVTFV